MHTWTYLELQNKWPFFNKRSSFFRGNSRFSLHFQWKTQKTVGLLYCNLQYLRDLRDLVVGRLRVRRRLDTPDNASNLSRSIHGDRFVVRIACGLRTVCTRRSACRHQSRRRRPSRHRRRRIHRGSRRPSTWFCCRQSSRRKCRVCMQPR